MLINNNELNRFFNEYMFWAKIDAYNKTVTSPNDLITTSNGRFLRQKLHESLVKNTDYNMSTVTPRVFRQELNQVMSDARVSDSFWEDTADLDTHEMLTDFKAFMNYSDATIKTTNGDFDLASTGHKDNVLPISPYDPRFANLGSILDDGSRLNGISVMENLSVSQLNKIRLMANTKLAYNVRLNQHNAVLSRKFGSDEMQPTVYSKADYTGIARIKSLVTTDEYEALQQNFASKVDMAHLSQSDLNAYQKMGKNASAILLYLKSNGYEYSLTNGQNGAVNVNILGYNTQVSLFNRPDRLNYTSTVTHQGAVSRYMSTLHQDKKRYVPDVTPEMAVDLVKYSLGVPIHLRNTKGEEISPDTNNNLVGTRATTKVMSYGKKESYNMAFFTNQTAQAGVMPLMINGKRDQFHNLVMISTNRHNVFNQSSGSLNANAEHQDDVKLIASDKLRDLISSARNNFVSAVDLSNLQKLAENYQDDDSVIPDFSSDETVAAVQSAIWDVLTVKHDDEHQNVLLKPGVSDTDLMDAIAAAGEDGISKRKLNKYQYDLNLDQNTMINNYLQDCLSYYIGQYELDKNGQRFDPTNVIRYQSQTFNNTRTFDDIVNYAKVLNLKPSEIKGEGASLVANAMIKFKPETATKLSDLPQSDFTDAIKETIFTSLRSNGLSFKEDDVLIDDQGIVQYAGTVRSGLTNGLNRQGNVNSIEIPIKGTIGQIFVPDEQGIIKTKFAVNNYAVIPSYEAYIQPQKLGEHKSFEERTRLLGYKQLLLRAIQRQVRTDFTVNLRSLVPNKDQRLAVAQGEAKLTPVQVGTGASVNDVYRHLDGEHHDLDFIEQYREQKMPESIINALIATEGQRVRYDRSFLEGSTISNEYFASHSTYDLANDNNLDPYTLTGYSDLSILGKDADGYFDPIASNATTTKQGIIRYLAQGVKINNDGSLVATDKTGPNSRTTIMTIPETQYMSYDPFDRQNMCLSQLMKAVSVVPETNVAQQVLAGWNQDDGVIISKKYAKNHLVRNSDGDLRPLMVGDKISDFNGNKGVINLIVDPNMTIKDAKAQGLEEPVRLFKKNRDLEIVMAPFPEPSRYNGGTARQLMRKPQDLVGIDGKTIKGAMGSMPIIITDKSADEKTSIYGDEEYRQGKGRKVSAQLVWTLNAKDSEAIMREAFGYNDNALSDYHEYLNVLGLDIDAKGNLKPTILPETKNSKKNILFPELIYKKSNTERLPMIDMKKIMADFDTSIDQDGGIIDLPFNLVLANGQKTNTLPILSSKLRVSMDLASGSRVKHDYSKYYDMIVRDAVNYENADKQIDHWNEQAEKADLTEKEQKQLDRAKSNRLGAYNKAQNTYNLLTNKLISRVLSGRNNIYKDQLMGHRMSQSATSIWTADPRLNIDTIAMSPTMADKLGLANGDSTLLWRDPSLRDGSLRYMKIKVDDRLTGIAINPNMDKSFDGDFDGDTIGLLPLKTAAANREAKRLFSVKNNLLDYGSKNADGTYDLYMQHDLDVKVAEYKKPKLAERWANISKDVNDFEKQFKEGKINQAQVDIARTHAVESINEYYHDCYDGLSTANIVYDTPAHHLESVKAACLDTGAKGNLDKFSDYAKWTGFVFKIDSKGNCDFSNTKDAGHTLATREMQQETMKATAIKSFGTGIAGGYSQRGIRALRNVCPKAVTELTYPVTQSILQIKHDPVEAVKKYDILMSSARNLWRGYDMTKDEHGKWQINRDEKGQPLQATTDKWQAQFKQMYEEDLNVTPNMDYVADVAQGLSKNGFVQNIDTFTDGSPMDQLAYGGDSSTLLTLANEEKNLFAGKYNERYAPLSLTRNKLNLEQEEAAKAETKAQVASGKAITLGEDNSAYKPRTYLNRDTKADVAPRTYHHSKQVVQEQVLTADSGDHEVTNDSDEIEM